ncbi:helix-turn-helix transcriptional regulator [Myxococcota bacterium]|nr:helix-turn-helix transcriptional regulator [Myxococcota bacterium]
MKRKLKKPSVDLLTDREREVFDLIVKEGLNNTEIADRLGITQRAAKFHASNVLKKMETPDRLKLTVAFWASGAPAPARRSS